MSWIAPITYQLLRTNLTLTHEASHSDDTCYNNSASHHSYKVPGHAQVFCQRDRDALAKREPVESPVLSISSARASQPISERLLSIKLLVT